MDYGLMAFDGNHCGHMYTRTEYWRIELINAAARAALRRRGAGR